MTSGPALALLLALSGLSLPVLAVTEADRGEEADWSSDWRADWGSDWEADPPAAPPWERLSGFLELGLGTRLHSDPLLAQRRTLAETRVRLETAYNATASRLTFKGDLVYDDLLDGWETDLREGAWSRPLGTDYHLKAGRQVLTWGTGDYLFLNDLFPKDWQSFFSGRDDEYLKAPSNAVKLSRFGETLNLDLVWLPRFEGDRYLEGDRFSFFSPAAGHQVAPGVEVDEPNRPAWAARLYFSREGREWALYGYRGWSPQPLAEVDGAPAFYRLRVLGASVRAPAGPGLMNLELAHHRSDDGDGSNPTLPNRQWRALIGYEQELLTRLNLGLQYYLERTSDHDALLAASRNPALEPDRYRHLVTLRAGYRSALDRLRLSLFVFYSPSDHDHYLRPQLELRPDDRWRITAGANLFGGDHLHTPFGQQEKASNLFLRLRYHY